MWDIDKHVKNASYIESIKDKLVVIALAGLETEPMTFDFLADFRGEFWLLVKGPKLMFKIE